jgi:hypothetical protein
MCAILGGVERRGLRDLHMVRDVSAADWIADGLESFGRLAVGSLVPGGFEGYARLFHPAYHSVVAHPAHPAHGAHDDEAEVRWDTIAAAGNRQPHAGMQWPAITGASGDDLWDEEPEAGSLPIAQATSLLAVLTRFTGSDDCFYAVWDGFGALSVPLDGPRLALPSRPMILLRGPLADAADLSMGDWPWQQSPSLWWPSDRAWCVATDVDQTSTYVGGSAACIEAVVTEPALEAWPVDRTQSLTGDSDTVNRPSRLQQDLQPAATPGLPPAR